MLGAIGSLNNNGNNVFKKIHCKLPSLLMLLALVVEFDFLALAFLGVAASTLRARATSIKASTCKHKLISHLKIVIYKIIIKKKNISEYLGLM